MIDQNKNIARNKFGLNFAVIRKGDFEKLKAAFLKAVEKKFYLIEASQ